MRIKALANGLAFLAIVATASAQAPAEIDVVGSPEGVRETTPFDISDDGVVVGSTAARNEQGKSDLRAFRWDGQMRFVGVPSDGRGSGFIAAATSISDDGRIVVGHTSIDYARKPYKIVGDGAPIDLEGIYPYPGITGFGFVIVSGDGRVLIGGQHGNGGRAVRIVEDGPKQALGRLTEKGSSEALAASFDGSVIVGVATTDETRTRAFRWTVETGMVDLGALNDERPASQATAVSSDGSIVAGTSETIGGFLGRRNIPFVWTAAEGMTKLPELENRPDGDYYVETVSGDGRVIGGAAKFGAEMPTALLWIDRKPIELATLLKNERVDLSMWAKLYTVEAVSSNGTYVTGYGSYYGKPGPGGWLVIGRTGYRAKLPPATPVDGK